MLAASKRAPGRETDLVQVIEHGGVRFAEVIRANAFVSTTKFFSPAGSSFQFGLLAHGKGFEEAAHTHKPVARTIKDLQQMFVVQRGKVEVRFYRDNGERLDQVILNQGDAILLVHGGHSVHVLEDMQCVSVKQGPFLGDEQDKVALKGKS